LKYELKELYGEDPFMVIGNYPYNISSQIFFKVLEYRDQIPFVSGMLQKEVAERIASKPGKKAYGILSVLLQAYYDIEYLFTVPPSVFNPPPKVQSAVISLKRNSRESLPCDEKLFKTVVKTTFNQRRKTIRNSIKPLIPDGDFTKKEDIDLLTKRPEQLSVEEFIRLTEWLAQ
jgi:16S rRNA (adenine1518-N6/adenine1519-N6)-dimethyltransferase